MFLCLFLFLFCIGKVRDTFTACTHCIYLHISWPYRVPAFITVILGTSIMVHCLSQTQLFGSLVNWVLAFWYSGYQHFDTVDKWLSRSQHFGTLINWIQAFWYTSYLGPSILVHWYERSQNFGTLVTQVKALGTLV